MFLGEQNRRVSDPAAKEIAKFYVPRCELLARIHV